VPPRPSGWTAGRIVLVVIGSLLALLALGVLAAGAALTWGATTQRDDDGYFATDAEQLSSAGYAITSDEIDLGSDVRPRRWGSDIGDLVRVRFRATPVDPDQPVFVGIARSSDVDEYLADVAHDVVRDVDFDPFRVDYRTVTGDRDLAPPDEQDFWTVSSAGTGRQTVEWEPDEGHWTVVVANADAGRGVSADVDVGVRIRHLWLIVAILLGLGALLLAAGVVMIILGARGTGAPGAAPPAVAPPGAPAEVPALAATVPTEREPVLLSGRLDEPLSRWLWLVKWLLAIPHALVLVVLWIVAIVLTVVAGVAILFTGRFPRGIFDFNLGVLRWTWRVVYYATGVLGTDRYPPFTLGEVADYPATLQVAYPEQLSRGLVLVKWWLLAIPHYLIIGIFGTGWWWGALRIGDGDLDRGAAAGSGGLLGLLVLIAAVRLLFTNRYPREMFDFVMGLNRWAFRVAAYALLMTDVYPPFRLDQGGTTR
jgi:hypothetical protein